MNNFDKIALQVLDMQYRHARKIAPRGHCRALSFEIAWHWTCKVLPDLERGRAEEFKAMIIKHYKT